MGDYFKTANYRQNSLVAAVDRAFNGARESVIGRGWGPLVVLARTTIIALMERISQGQLRVLTQDGIYTFGNPSVCPDGSTDGRGPPVGPLGKRRGERELRAELRVVNDAFWVRMFFLSDLGFAEAYMVGDVEVDDLDSLFKMFILNRSNLSEMSMTTSSIFSGINYLMNSRFVNSLSNSLSNISAHYDLPVFSSFLSADMTYSCALFPPHLGGLEGDLAPPSSTPRLSQSSGQDELELAQYEKIDLIIRNARISKGDRVLEIGSGWGSFAMRAVSTTGCEVDTITLSVEQQAIAQERIAEAGMSDSIRVHLVDYRALPEEWKGRFDRVVSIEMIEAVGLEYLEAYFEVVDKMLKPDRGVGVFQVITIPESRFERYRREVDFIRKWIFPGGVLPTVTFLVDAVAKGSRNRLLIERIENIGPHYARTLREWQRRFEASFEGRIVPALKEAYPEIDGRKDVEVFKRKWIYYFSYCAAGFSARVLGDHVFTVTREGNMSLYEPVRARVRAPEEKE